MKVACYFFNHGEATRVMWTPPLRESWAFPFLILQLFLMTRLLDQKQPDRSLHVPIGIGILLLIKLVLVMLNSSHYSFGRNYFQIFFYS